MNNQENHIDNKSRLAAATNKNTYADAEAELNKLKLLIIFDVSESESHSQQAALITAVNTGKRCFQGGVYIHLKGFKDKPFLLPWEMKGSIDSVISCLGGQVVDKVQGDEYSFILYFGGTAEESNSLQVVSDSWHGGIIKSEKNPLVLNDNKFPLGGIMAGSLAVGKSFLYVTDQNKSGVLDDTILSLWDNTINSNIAPSVTITNLPKNIWLLGLGHLGQAYLWTLSMLPYRNPESTNFLLQDFDLASLSNWESSLLTEKELIGKKKTRICNDWIQRRGFSTTLLERKFDNTFKRQDSEPGILLSGLDNVSTRLSIDPTQFSLVIDCGLGGDVNSFDQLSIRVLPNLGKRPSEIWDEETTKKVKSKRLSDLYENAFGCGYTDKGISTSFVGAFASTLVVAELIKAYNKGNGLKIVSMTLRDINDSYRLSSHTKYTSKMALEGVVSVSQ